MAKDANAPLIGQFSGPPVNSLREAAVTSRKVDVITGIADTGKKEPGAFAETSEAKDTSMDSLRSKTPAEKAKDYLSGLEEVNLTLTDARGIMEKILVNGVYEESKKLGSISVTFRTRSYKDVNRTLRFLELEKPTYAMGINDLVARYNMAASLESFGEEKFEHPTTKSGATDDQIETAFHKRLSFIMDLPVVTTNRLLQILYDFDRKIGAVFAEGAPEDF
jgi:hypothetical protein